MKKYTVVDSGIKLDEYLLTCTSDDGKYTYAVGNFTFKDDCKMIADVLNKEEKRKYMEG